MKVLIIGSGGREHALAWKLAQSSEVSKVYTAPGNPGTAEVGENVDIQVHELEKLRDFALTEGIELTVVGPEQPLTDGIVDVFAWRGLKAFGPDKKSAQLEGSKAFSKELMKKYNIPTADFGDFTDADAAKAYVKEVGAPIVVKADGLAAGKGVIICQTTEEANSAIDTIMTDRAFGEAGSKVVIEEFLTGEEASYIAITDGVTVLPFAPSQDHKAAYDGDKGPNTGGMGAYSPAPIVTPELEKEVMETIMVPTVKAMEAEGLLYRGFLYAGLMIKDGRPKVLEFNCRFGDPECQPILSRLKSDLLPVLNAAADGELHQVKLDWDPRPAVCVVMASEGYPGSYEKGRTISGIADADAVDGVKVFHAGTAEKDGEVVNSGGRVLGVTALGDDIEGAIATAYEGVSKISFEGAFYRTDIGAKALK